MDDFGTGYSSLSNLRAFPFDKIKIDSSFIRSVDVNGQTAAIVRSVLGLGRGLDLPVLAEGVETEQELRFLEAEGCQGVQGYLIGRPAAIDEFHAHTHGTPPRRAPRSGRPDRIPGPRAQATTKSSAPSRGAPSRIANRIAPRLPLPSES